MRAYIEITREWSADLFIGPYSDMASAIHALDNSPFIDCLAQEDSLDVFTRELADDSVEASNAIIPPIEEDSEMTTQYQRKSITNVSDIRAVADHAGSHFFDAASMRFFNSRILSGVISLDGTEAREGSRFLFITSERYADAPRHYAVRMITLGSVRDNRPSVDIFTMGGPYPTPSWARRAALALSEAL